MAQDRDYWRTLVNAALKLPVPSAMNLVSYFIIIIIIIIIINSIIILIIYGNTPVKMKIYQIIVRFSSIICTTDVN